MLRPDVNDTAKATSYKCQDTKAERGLSWARPGVPETPRRDAGFDHKKSHQLLGLASRAHSSHFASVTDCRLGIPCRLAPREDIAQQVVTGRPAAELPGPAAH